MTIRYSRRALAQLGSIHAYLVERHPRAARDVRASIQVTIARPRHLPLLGKLTDEGDVRVIIEPEYLYRVFYRVSSDAVLIIRVLHRSQR